MFVLDDRFVRSGFDVLGGGAQGFGKQATFHHDEPSKAVARDRCRRNRAENKGEQKKAFGIRSIGK